MRQHNLLALAALSSLMVTGAGPSGGNDPTPPVGVDRAHVAARVVEHLTAELSSGLAHSVFRRVEAPNADLCRVDLRTEGGATTHTTWIDFGPRRWVSTSRRREANGSAYWMASVASFDAKGRPVRVVTEYTYDGAPMKTQVAHRTVWHDDGAVVARRWFGAGLLEEYVIDGERSGLVRVFRSWNGEPLVEHHTLEIGEDRMRLRVSDLPDVFITYEWKEDGSIDYVSSNGQGEAIYTRYDPNGVLSDTPPWEIEVDDAGRPVVADSGGHHDAHFSYGCDWPEGAPASRAR